ncbi:MAG TPA: nodulation protein NfeD, partial [Candidatus Limnocylindrales bacterium]|nr:nodulation protein NfeD [Candidatus Limnocylindrales bacterium]
RRGVAAVVFTIDTPGGLIVSTYKITSRMLTARVPVVTYVGPSGARAASAGTFITMAGHVAAMAPATNIGAAHPVDASGGDIEGDLRDKVENDAVAEIRKIADARGRNADWAEQAVRESVSITDATALELRVVDLVVRDQTALLAEIDGRSVSVDGEPWTIATAGAEVEDHPFGLIETILHFITNPQVAILLFTIGTYGIIFELSNPSLIFPGVVGVISIILALFAFGSLDANAAGVALMAFAVLMFLAEIWVASHGILAVGGVAALILGILLVFPAERPTFPGFRYTVDPMTFIVVVGMTVLFFGLVLRASMRYVQLPTATGTDLLVGRRGTARSDLRPSGIVNVGGEDWTAESEGEEIPTGTRVRVRRVEGVRLIVAPDTAPTGAGRGA